MNEGNFRSGNGSLSFFSYDSLKLFNHVFQEVNKRPLGDIPYSINILGGKAYIVVNNSGKIEVADQNNMTSAATIDGINSPRYIAFVSDVKAYVTSLYSDSVTIIRSCIQYNLRLYKYKAYIRINSYSFYYSLCCHWAGE